MSQMEDWLLLSDLVLEEPRLQPCAGTAEVRFAGLGSAREGAGSGWLVFAEPAASARHMAHELADAAAIIVLADETVGRGRKTLEVCLWCSARQGSRVRTCAGPWMNCGGARLTIGHGNACAPTSG